MDYDERTVIEETIFKYHSRFLTSHEHELRGAFQARAKGEAYDDPQVEERMRAQMKSLGDPAIEDELTIGFGEFRRRVTERILREHGSELTFNRCPACARIVKTPSAKQCKWCTHDWH